MLTYDIRIILAILIFSYFLMNKAQIKFKQVKTMFIYVGIFLITNFILTFLFSPTYGCEIYGTKHVLFPIFGRYEVTLEQLFYQCTKFLKYLSVIPLGMIFFLTTNPSEFASSLNHIKVNYKVCTSLSLTLRYFTDVQRDYHTISLAQQARGLEMSSKAKLINRIKNVVTILTPLIFTTMDRIELITNAMELRGFGKGKKRSWYSFKPLQTKDWISMFICLLIFLFMLYIRIFVNKSMFYNPFI